MTCGATIAAFAKLICRVDPDRRLAHDVETSATPQRVVRSTVKGMPGRQAIQSFFANPARPSIVLEGLVGRPERSVGTDAGAHIALPDLGCGGLFSSLSTGGCNSGVFAALRQRGCLYHEVLPYQRRQL